MVKSYALSMTGISVICANSYIEKCLTKSLELNMTMRSLIKRCHASTPSVLVIYDIDVLPNSGTCMNPVSG